MYDETTKLFKLVSQLKCLLADYLLPDYFAPFANAVCCWNIFPIYIISTTCLPTVKIQVV